MAKEIGTRTQDGRVILVYDNGMERDQVTKKIVKPPTNSVIRTREQSLAAHRRRKEKAARALRTQIKESILDPNPNLGPAEVWAMAAGMVWRDVVLNPEAYPRDRLEALIKLGKIAEIVDPDQDPGSGTQDQDAGLLQAMGTELARQFLEARREARTRTRIIDPDPDPDPGPKDQDQVLALGPGPKDQDQDKARDPDPGPKDTPPTP